MDGLKVGGAAGVAIVGVSTESLIAVGVMLVIVILAYFIIRSIWTKAVEPATISFCQDWAKEARKKKAERERKAAAKKADTQQPAVSNTP